MYAGKFCFDFDPSGAIVGGIDITLDGPVGQNDNLYLALYDDQVDR